MSILKEATPVARKEHKCMFCYCTINKGQKYFRQTNVVDGIVGDWVCHQECQDVAKALSMYDVCDPDYIYDEHYDRETDDVAKEWQGLTRYEEVCKILNELEVE